MQNIHREPTLQEREIYKLTTYHTAKKHLYAFFMVLNLLATNAGLTQ